MASSSNVGPWERPLAALCVAIVIILCMAHHVARFGHGQGWAR